MNEVKYDEYEAWPEARMKKSKFCVIHCRNIL